MKIIVDAFGGDHAPLEILKGAMQAVDAYDVDIILTGKEAEIRRCAAENRLQLRRTRIVDAPQVITMEDDAKSVLRSKKDSSLGVAFQLLKAGEGDALVSAGNTGAVTVGATLITGRIKGVKRPAIASVMPSASKPFLMMDCGANAECKPEFLYQFGLLGSLYMQHVLHVKNPRVALANNGTEPTRLNKVPPAFSRRSCTQAQGRCPVAGSMSPTGFIGPNRGASAPRFANFSMGIQPSYTSKSWVTAPSACTSASINASYSARLKGQFK